MLIDGCGLLVQLERQQVVARRYRIGSVRAVTDRCKSTKWFWLSKSVSNVVDG